MWTRPRGGRRPKLSREAIVEAAIKVADAEGLEAVSIRRIASELGVRAMSLYTHIDAKEDLLDLMRDEVTREVLVQGEQPEDWREAVSEIARKELEAGLRHPWMLQLTGRSRRIGPNGLRHIEQTLAAAAGLTEDPDGIVAVVKAIDHYVLGFTIMEQYSDGAAREPIQATPLDQSYVRLMMERGEFPHLRSFLGTSFHHDRGFELGLKWLLDGIEHDYRGEWPSTTGPT